MSHGLYLSCIYLECSFDQAFTRYGIHTLFALMIAALVTWAHRGNIQRIREGTERKLQFGKKDGNK